MSKDGAHNPDNPFYVYVLLRSEASPFYVGKGSGGRVDYHETEARSGCQCHKCRVIRKVWRAGRQIIKSIVYTTNREADAYCFEAALIASIGLSNLTNVQPGKDGVLTGAVASRRDSMFWSEHERRYYLVKNGCSKEVIEKTLRRERQMIIEDLQSQRKAARALGRYERIHQIDDEILALRLSLGYTSFIEQRTLW